MLRQRHFGGRAPAFVFGLALLVAVPLAAAYAFDAKKADLSIIRVVVFEIKNGKRTGTYSFGTGFVVANEYVVTNNHVTDDSDFTKDGGSSERVVVDGSTKNLRPAQLIWNSTELDLAVVRVPGLTRPSLTLSSAPPMEYPEKAAAVWAIGFPGLADRSITSETAFSMSTITQGVVGKVVMGRASQRDKVRPVIQHNASINKGNSGGPLFDNCGLVVGVNTFGAVSTMEVSRDQKGRDIAAGMPNTGIFYSPHIGNFIEAQKTVAALAPIKLTLSAAPCTAAVAEPPGLPVWVYGIIGVVALLALTSTFVAFRKGTTREIVRVVESYSGYIRRKGEPPSVRAHKAERSRTAPRGAPSSAPSRTAPPHVAEAAAPAGASKLVLTGRSKEQSFRVEIGADELEAAAAKSDRGIVLGRSRSLSDKVVDDPSISRRHAKFFLADGMLMVEDMGSAYGTKINGKKLGANEAGALKPGDKLGIGGVTLEVGRA
jgi:trypsin-like peptidase/FHA domain-containing protein